LHPIGEAGLGANIIRLAVDVILLFESFHMFGFLVKELSIFLKVSEVVTELDLEELGIIKVLSRFGALEVEPQDGVQDTSVVHDVILQ